MTRPCSSSPEAHEELDAHLELELIVSKARLRSILASYWDPEWRRDNRGGTSPEDQLWRAATTVTEIESALIERAP